MGFTVLYSLRVRILCLGFFKQSYVEGTINAPCVQPGNMIYGLFLKTGTLRLPAHEQLFAASFHTHTKKHISMGSHTWRTFLVI